LALPPATATTASSTTRPAEPHLAGGATLIAILTSKPVLAAADFVVI
jgi:hypothetical protein